MPSTVDAHRHTDQRKERRNKQPRAVHLVAHARMGTTSNRALIRRAAIPIIAVRVRGTGGEWYTGARSGTRTRMAVRLVTFGIHEHRATGWTPRFKVHPGEVSTDGVLTLTAGVSLVPKWCRRH